ncbi:MAG: ATP-binding cassette domain-containing protein [Bacillota bacterium]|nr:ATP-binding cassette domain-containing protein [Bacillota bacterium]
MSEALISMRGIKKSYGQHEVLQNVDLDIYKGDIFGLIGRNGAGKTTLFKVILGLSDYQGGTLEIAGESKKLSIGRKKIGFLIGSNFLPYMNGRQNLEYYRVLKGIKDKKEIDRVLEIVELAGVKSPYKNYSLGMKQRLGIANAMMGNPEILILDEPTNGLDPQGIADVRALIQRLNEEFNMTVIVSSHILGELQNTAHRFGIINSGTLAGVITREDLVTEQRSVRLSVDDLEKARVALEQAGVKIFNEVYETRTLEDFYFTLVGGKN